MSGYDVTCSILLMSGSERAFPDPDFSRPVVVMAEDLPLGDLKQEVLIPN